MEQLQEFARLFELPPAMLSYVEYVVSEQELDLVVALDGRKLTLAETAELLQLPPAEAKAFLTESFHRHVIRRETDDDGIVRYSAGTFYERLNPFSMYGKWGDVPAEAREAVLEWELETYIEKKLEAIEQMKQDPDALVQIENRDVLLLEEALAQVEAAEEHVVLPCDCKTIQMACDYPVEVCVRLDEGARVTLEHGMGRAVSKEEMKRIVIDAHRAGLMQTGSRDPSLHDGKVFGFCNCCGCCCYPIVAGDKMGLHRVWPRAHYLAERDASKCSSCGICHDRCHFDAFYVTKTAQRKDGTTIRVVGFAVERCIGCGLCASACPEGAISMRPLTPAEDAEIEALRKSSI